MRERVYVAAPMRGIKHFNFPAILRAGEELRTAGYDVFSPAERDMAHGFDPVLMDLTGNEDLAELGFDLRDALAADLEYICRYADAVVVLPGWGSSKGALAEVAAARALNLRVARLDHALASHETVAVDCE